MERLSEYDATKLRVLAAFAAIRIERQDVALSLLRGLQFDFLFGKWAQRALERVPSHGNAATA